MTMVRIRFCGNHGKFYIQQRRGPWPFRFWQTIGVIGHYISENKNVRFFSTFCDAEEFAKKLMVDIIFKVDDTHFLPKYD